MFWREMYHSLAQCQMDPTEQRPKHIVLLFKHEEAEEFAQEDLSKLPVDLSFTIEMTFWKGPIVFIPSYTKENESFTFAQSK